MPNKARHYDQSSEESAEPCAASLPFDAAIALIDGMARPLGTESVPIARAGRRILAAPVRSGIDAPPYRAAAMDGFAVREADLHSPFRGLRVVGQSYPAAPWRRQVGPGEAVRIMTGAEVPAGCDRVLPIEIVAEHDGHLTLPVTLPDRTHVRERGSDMRAGAIVLPAGAMLDPRRLLVASAADAETIEVWRQPMVRAIASGDELVAPGRARLGEGRIPDSLSESLLLLARQWGAKPDGAARVADDAGAIADAARAAVDGDVLLMIGGASRGDRDFARAALIPLGLRPVFEGVAMKPGKPVWYGRVGGCHVLGLPGNPTAAFTVARLFLVPLLCALGGRGLRAGLTWHGRPLANAMPASGPREAFLCGQSGDDGVTVLDRQLASFQRLLADADVLVRIPANAPPLPAGTLVDTIKL